MKSLLAWIDPTDDSDKAKLVSGLKVFALVAVSIATFPLVFVVAVLWMVGDMMAEARDREIL